MAEHLVAPVEKKLSKRKNERKWKDNKIKIKSRAHIVRVQIFVIINEVQRIFYKFIYGNSLGIYQEFFMKKSIVLFTEKKIHEAIFLAKQKPCLPQ